LTNELVAWAPLSNAPVFSSLLEEGMDGAGYDVQIKMLAAPLYRTTIVTSWRYDDLNRF
jgi:hypothetical protein